LAGCNLAAAREFRFPDPLDKSRFDGLRDRARHFHETTGYALIAGSPATLFYLTSELVGFEEYLEKLLEQHDETQHPRPYPHRPAAGGRGARLVL
jgi:hypothetical protein